MAEQAKSGRFTTLDCKACGSENSMAHMNIQRFLSGLRLVGTLIVVPSLLGLAACALMLVGLFGSTIPGGGVVSFGICLGLAGVSIVSGTVGWFLLSDRHVWCCKRCGAYFDRSPIVP